jgi:hypothetical protein
MAELKTKLNDGDVQAFLNTVENDAKKQDCLAIINMMRDITGQEPKMWGASIIGFGTTHYKYESGREGDWFPVGFSPRKQNITLYFMIGFDRLEAYLKRLGKHKIGKSCLYINSLNDIDTAVLKEMIKETVA